MPCPKEPGAVKCLAAGGRGTKGVGPSLGSTTCQGAHSGFLAGVPMGGDQGVWGEWVQAAALRRERSPAGKTETGGHGVRRASPPLFWGSCLDLVVGGTGNCLGAQETGRNSLLGWKSSEDSSDRARGSRSLTPTLSPNFGTFPFTI